MLQYIIRIYLCFQEVQNLLEEQFTNEERGKSEIIECDRSSTENSIQEIQRLKDCENRLLGEIQELREQNELLEFRLLELEYYNINNSSKVCNYKDIRSF